MSPFRYREDSSSTTTSVLGAVAGALAGFAVGMVMAQKVGGFGGLTSRMRRRQEQPDDEARFSGAHGVHDADEDFEDDFEDIEDDELEDDEPDEFLEERVLEAFRNDPILAERAVDIGSIGEGIIELAGWVEDEDEAQHAVTIAGGVPGVVSVVNRIAIGDEERRYDEAVRRVEEGDPALTERRWESNVVGTGRRRQGTSDEPDRHSDPRVPLEERWSSTREALKNAADDTAETGDRRGRSGNRRSARGDRTGGAPTAPGGVPKGDHVANPTRSPRADEPSIEDTDRP